ncbi:nucleobase:cation symporter-1, NCS1 family [Amycolatopsis arida]|uniref:Nucleobase:cation symporter-1, NCS1 family n=1 Tax=Amycolatopsis arida TaxID=587909 RepID=A0A1I5UXA1_9PSEU|nr:NCS1 family nucleobase:cation symporter-1 [Amycolatopsis arida]TDX91069.1 NCS1 family nucleobase:cation symporter-1 [Amycolatopsis arida]SFP99838.1 nucleobase:cation symporter-1, NCS1 family [Amycolatopsis arida]
MEPAQLRHRDGRIELVDSAAIAGSRFLNPELAPVPVAGRRWTTYNYFALWMGMAHNIPSYLLASGLIAIGMNWAQAFLTITLGNLIVLIPMLLNSHAGTKYGIPFPVFARASYGVRGANLAALLRAFIACGWFGIQTWVGGQAIFVILGTLVGDGWLHAAEVFGQPWTMWLGFLAFWAFQMAIIWRGIDAVRRFENWSAPLVTVGFLILLVWVLVKAGSLGPIFSQPSRLGWGADFWVVFAPSLMGMIAFWATLSLNMPDFTRFGASQRKQALGQVLGLPTTMSFMAIVSIMITSGGIVIYGEAIWDPVELASRFDSPLVVVLALLGLGLATVSANLAANVVSPSYDFSNAFPRRISFRVGGLITGVLGIAIQPWRLIADPNIYIFAWLGFYGGTLAAVAGVLVADYWAHARTRLWLTDLYAEGGRYWFRGGWNWRALVATAVGAVLAVGGAYSEPGAGPFPADGLIPLFKPFYDYSWLVGLVAAFAAYLLLSRGAPSRAEFLRTTKEDTGERPHTGGAGTAAVDG